MIDALLFAVRDNIRSAGFGYGVAECDIQDDGHPPPRVGNIFVAVYEMSSRSTARRNLDEKYAYGVTLTMRVSIPVDRVGSMLLSSKLARASTNGQPSFNARMEQLRGFLHMNWSIMGVFDAVNTWTANSANANIAAWSPSSLSPVYGFIEPAGYTGRDKPELVGGEWFGSTPEATDMGLKCELRFDGARRLQPQTLPVGPNG